MLSSSVMFRSSSCHGCQEVSGADLLICPQHKLVSPGDHHCAKLKFQSLNCQHVVPSIRWYAKAGLDNTRTDPPPIQLESYLFDANSKQLSAAVNWPANAMPMAITRLPDKQTLLSALIWCHTNWSEPISGCQSLTVPQLLWYPADSRDLLISTRLL